LKRHVACTKPVYHLSSAFSGASIDTTDSSGNSPLIMAASHGYHEVVIFLAQCGCDLGHTNRDGKSAWDFALNFKDSKLLKV